MEPFGRKNAPRMPSKHQRTHGSAGFILLEKQDIANYSLVQCPSLPTCFRGDDQVLLFFKEAFLSENSSSQLTPREAAPLDQPRNLAGRRI